MKTKMSNVILRLVVGTVVFVLLLMLAVQFVPWFSVEEESNTERTIKPFLKKQAESIATAYSIDEKLASSKSYLSQFRDYWNKELQVDFGVSMIVVTSAGPDGTFGNSDDIIVEERIQK